MAIYNYEIGGNEIKPDASEGISAIPENRSMFVEQLTHDEPVNPEAVTGLSTVKDVFEHYKPTREVEFENGEGQPVKETLSFANVGDFNIKEMTHNSGFLNQVNTEKDFYTGLIKQLRSNKVLQRALEDPDAKAALIAALQGVQTELNEHSSKQ